MEPQGSFDWGSLAWILLRNGNHGLHTLRRHQHFVKSQKCILKCSSEIFTGLVLSLLPKFIRKEPLTKLCALDAAVTIKDCEETNTIVELWVHNVCVFLGHITRKVNQIEELDQNIHGCKCLIFIRLYQALHDKLYHEYL